MQSHYVLLRLRLIRLVGVIALIAGALGTAPLARTVLAAPTALPEARSALVLLPSPAITINVNTTTIANDNLDGNCDLWEAMQADVNANLEINNAQKESSAPTPGLSEPDARGPKPN